MAAPIRVLVDLNVILDTLQKREPHYPYSAQTLAHAEIGAFQGLVAAHSWITLFYLYARDQSPDQARVHLTQLLQFLSVALVDQSVIESALSLPYRDFEDAVQMMAAVRAGADYLLTQNPYDYRAGPLPVLRPAELLALLPLFP
jgi:predicted nucleic acid-binding protein